MSNRDDLSALESHVCGALLGTFTGDALGMPVEGWTPQRIQSEHGVIHSLLPADNGSGTYTDDTQMMIALAKSLLACEGVDQEHLAQSFQDHFEPSRGYGQGTSTVISKWKQGMDLQAAATSVYDEGSFGNGGAMRIAPVGVLYGDSDPSTLKTIIDKSVGITHAHPRGRAGAFYLARAIGLALDYLNRDTRFSRRNFLNELRESPPEEYQEDIWEGKFQIISHYLDDLPIEPERVAQELGNSSAAHESVPTAIFSFLSHQRSFEECATYAVSIGGDTDTIGAMAGALGGVYKGVQSIPDEWWKKLENQTDGRDDVLELGVKLTELRKQLSS